MKSPWYFVLALLGVILAMSLQLKHNDDTIDILESNLKAIKYSSDSIKTHNSTLQISQVELKTSTDSIVASLRHSLDSLGVQYKKLKNVSYIRSKASKTDTIIFRDTILQKDLSLDTLLQDRWSSISLSLRYPDTISVSPGFTSEKHVVFSYKRETIKPRSKIFFIRWFQKKHTIVEVRVFDKNPYIKEEENRFIDIVK